MKGLLKQYNNGSQYLTLDKLKRKRIISKNITERNQI